MLILLIIMFAGGEVCWIRHTPWLSQCPGQELYWRGGLERGREEEVGIHGALLGGNEVWVGND